jgi:hypothetical protein
MLAAMIQNNENFTVYKNWKYWHVGSHDIKQWKFHSLQVLEILTCWQPWYKTMKISQFTAVQSTFECRKWWQTDKYIWWAASQVQNVKLKSGLQTSAADDIIQIQNITVGRKISADYIVQM